MPAAAVSVSVAAAMAFGAWAHAATVTALRGQVLVNGGSGYRLVDGSTQLAPGGMVVANPGATARVIYAANCEVTVQPGSVYMIAMQPPCKTGAPISTGALTPAGNPIVQKTATTDDDGGVNPWLIGGGLALAVGGGAAYLITSMSP